MWGPRSGRRIETGCGGLRSPHFLTDMTEPDKPENQTTPTLWQTVSSVAASFFGVQSSKNRQRDFSKGRAGHFIAIGLLMTVLLVLGVWLAVKLALRSAGM